MANVQNGVQLKNIIYMKYGVHASEPIEKIILRKEKEIAENGWGLWGYGGTLCHPINQVQPFARRCIQNGENVYLAMESTASEFWNTPYRAEEYSLDKKEWHKLPDLVNVYGSKVAICIKSITKCDFDLDMSEYEIAVGPSAGRNLSEYIKARTDKACARRVQNLGSHARRTAHITLIAEIIDPYAVFVK